MADDNKAIRDREMALREKIRCHIKESMYVVYIRSSGEDTALLGPFKNLSTAKTIADTYNFTSTFIQEITCVRASEL